MKKYPIFLIVFLRFLSALPFSIFYSSLQLYLIDVGFSKNISISLVGSVLALSFGLSLLGGYLGGRYISFRMLFIVSVIFQAIGCLVFSLHNHSLVLWLSCIFLLGSIGNTIGINMMITQRFLPGDYSREKAFFWMYMSLNFGYFLGYSLAGIFGNLNEYIVLPVFVFVFSIISLILVMLNWPLMKDSNPLKEKNFLILLGCFLAVLIFSRLLLAYSSISNFLIIAIWLLCVGSSFLKLTKLYPNKKIEIKVFYILLFSALIFWSIYFLAPMALLIFIKNNVSLNFSYINIAPQWIQNINTLVIVIGTIVLASKKNPKKFDSLHIGKQFSFGLFFLALGFLVLFMGIVFTSKFEKISILWVILSYIFQSIGELMIGPAGFSLIGRLIPEAYRGFMMGIWVTSLGVASAVASKLSLFTPSTKLGINLQLTDYSFLFLCVFIILIFSSLLTYKIIYFLNKKAQFTCFDTE